MNIHDWLTEWNDEALLADGFDDAIIGIGQRCGSDPVVVYDTDKIISMLIEKGMDESEAQEYFDFNILGSYVGPGTPMYITKFKEE